MDIQVLDAYCLLTMLGVWVQNWDWNTNNNHNFTLCMIASQRITITPGISLKKSFRGLPKPHSNHRRVQAHSACIDTWLYLSPTSGVWCALCWRPCSISILSTSSTETWNLRTSSWTTTATSNSQTLVSQCSCSPQSSWEVSRAEENRPRQQAGIKYVHYI